MKPSLSLISLNIYNVSNTNFNLIGATINVLSKSGSSRSSEEIKKIKNFPGTTTPTTYNGDSISLSKHEQISFTPLTNFKIKRITILCNNVEPRSIMIYFQNNMGKFSGIQINKLTNHILIIDLYNN